MRGADVLASIAANVRRLRERAGLSQAALAEAADLDLRFVQRVESAKVNLGVVYLVALAKALDVPPGRLLRPASFEPRAPGRPRLRRAM